MRLFIAVEVSAEIRQRIIKFVDQMRPGLAHARWSRPEGLHITLKFLGNVADERRSPIEDALARIKALPFQLSLRNVGVFPNPKSPRVLWVGIDCGPELSGLARTIDDAFAPLGFAREKRAFTPHVTLARFKEGSRTSNLATLLPEGNLSFGTMTATEFHLYESKLSPRGSSYSKLSSFALK